MSRSGLAAFAGVTALILLSSPAHGQTMVEAPDWVPPLTGASGARNAGKSIGGAFRNLDKVLKSVDSTTDSKEDPPASSNPAQPAAKQKAAAGARSLPERAAPQA